MSRTALRWKMTYARTLRDGTRESISMVWIKGRKQLWRRIRYRIDRPAYGEGDPRGIHVGPNGEVVFIKHDPGRAGQDGEGPRRSA